MKNKHAFLGMIFGADIGIIFNNTGLGLPMGAGADLILSLILSKQKKKNK
jgi:hypothetical protein